MMTRPRVHEFTFAPHGDGPRRFRVVIGSEKSGIEQFDGQDLCGVERWRPRDNWEDDEVDDLAAALVRSFNRSVPVGEPATVIADQIVRRSIYQALGFDPDGILDATWSWLRMQIGSTVADRDRYREALRYIRSMEPSPSARFAKRILDGATLADVGVRTLTDNGDRRGTAASTPEPDPTPNDGPAIWDLVIADLDALLPAFSPDAAENLRGLIRDARDRDAAGRERYGTRLQANNGRDPIVDAYQEALDLVVYLRQAVEEGRLSRRLYDQAITLALGLRICVPFKNLDG